MNDEPWLVAFDMAWFQRSKDIMPEFREFARKHDKELNIGLIDCWTEEGHAVCGKMDTRTYPAFYYFPGKAEIGDQQPYIVKYLDRRQQTEEKWRKFFLEGGYKNADMEQYIPITNYGVNAFDRWT